MQVHTHNTHTHTHTRSSDDADGGSEEGRGFVDEGTTSLRHGGHTKGGLGGVSGGGVAAMSRRGRKQERRAEEEALLYDNLDVEVNL